MKRKSSTQLAFLRLRTIIVLVVGVSAILVVLLSKANSKTLVADYMRQPNKLLSPSPGGAQEGWVARYDGPATNDDEATAITVDGSGNIYVTGFSFDPNTDYDYATIKYNSAGQQQWVARYDGPENYTDQATAITVDPAGNVYVTGGSSSNAGSLDYTTIKYNSAGQQQWVARYDSQNGFSKATGLAIDNSGNIYVTGGSYGSGLNYDYATIKYNSAGQEQWVARYDGPANSDDEARAMAIDGTGNIYVTGYSNTSDNGSDYTTIKYNSTGQQQWVARYGSQAGVDGAARPIALDDSDNVYVTGLISDPGMDYDYGTIKYDASGEQQWVARYDGQTSSEDLATAIAVDGSGNVYVTGTTDADSSFWSGGDYTTIKYNSAGQEQWVEQYAGPGSYTDWPTAIALDASGNVIVTGYSYGSDTDFDYATIKYAQQSTPTPTPTATPTPTPCTGRCGPTPRPRPTPHVRPTPP